MIVESFCPAEGKAPEHCLPSSPAYAFQAHERAPGFLLGARAGTGSGRRRSGKQIESFPKFTCMMPGRSTHSVEKAPRGAPVHGTTFRPCYSQIRTSGKPAAVFPMLVLKSLPGKRAGGAIVRSAIAAGPLPCAGPPSHSAVRTLLQPRRTPWVSKATTTFPTRRSPTSSGWPGRTTCLSRPSRRGMASTKKRSLRSCATG